MIYEKTAVTEDRRALLDVGDRLVDLERLGNRDTARRAEIVILQTAKVRVE